MKIICLVKNTTDNNNFYINLFESLGHTVTLLPITTEITSNNIIGYDIVVFTSLDNTQCFNLINYCYTNNIKFIFGTYSHSAAISFATYYDNSNGYININGNDINNNFKNNTINLHNQSYYSSIIVTNSTDNYISFANGTNISTSVAGIASNYCFIGFLPWNDAVSITTEGLNYIKLIINYFTANNFTKYYIKGTITNINNVPVSREIRVYNPITGELITKTRNKTDGSYVIDLLSQTPVMVVCVGEKDTHYNNTVVCDNVIPLEK